MDYVLLLGLSHTLLLRSAAVRPPVVYLEPCWAAHKIADGRAARCGGAAEIDFSDGGVWHSGIQIRYQTKWAYATPPRC